MVTAFVPSDTGLGWLSGQQQADSGLDLPGGGVGALVVVSQTRGLTGNRLQYITLKGLHDAHGLGRDAGVRLDLLQHLVHIDSMSVLPGSRPCSCHSWWL